MMPWEDVQVQLIDTPPVTDTAFEPYLINIVRSADAVLLCLDGSSDNGPDETAVVVQQFESRKTLLSNRTGFDEEDFSIIHIKTLLVVTHADDPGCSDRVEFFREVLPRAFDTINVELTRSESAEELRNRIYGLLGVIRVYTKRPGKPADMKDPYTIPLDGTIEDLALKIHRDMAETLKFARVWGASAYDGQSVGRDHRLADKDVVELHA